MASQEHRDIIAADTESPIVVVGSGPVGVRLVQELRRLNCKQPVVLYGDERFEPYNRVQLSGLLGGQHRVQDLNLATDGKAGDGFELSFRQQHIAAIDPERRTVTEASGTTQPFSKLVLATGSRPFVPAIVGSELAGVFTFRDMADAEKLAARRVQSKRTVVLGAGLLGIEAARGMQRHHVKVTLIDHNPHPMFRQLDGNAGELLAEELEARNIELMLGTSVRMILGTQRVEAVILRDGTEIPCDTVIVATGIRPKIDLAKAAGLAFGRGVTVDDAMRTSAADIYAIGECCELAGEVFGLVAPGYEQAAILARNFVDQQQSDTYFSRQLATSLKVAGLSVFSMGPAHPPTSMVSVRWRDDKDYRRISLVGGRITGINAIGDWSELAALRELANKRQWISPWQLWRFRRTGQLLSSAATKPIIEWPAATIVCNCNSVSAGALREAVAGGAKTVSALTQCTHAGSACGSCKPLMQEMLGDHSPPEPVKGARGLGALVMPATVIAILAAIISISYPSSVQVDWDWGELWRSESYKQASGFTILGLCIASVVFSLRKRMPLVKFGDFAWWRLAHVAITLVAIVALGVHSGFRFGDNLNFWLSATFTTLLLAGALLGIAIRWEHRLAPATARQLRAMGLWTHVVLSWPLPALLGAHVLKTYYF